MEYYVHLAILIGIYSILAQSFNLVFGLGSSFNLAHVASYAIGAYATALLSTDAEWSVVPCMCASFVLGGLLASLIGGISSRLSNDYFAIGTLAFSAVVSAVLVNWKSLTRGVLGIPGIPRPTIGTVELTQNVHFLLLTLFCALLAQVSLYVLFRNRFSRCLRAQSESESAARALGIDTRSTRVVSFLVASSFAGLSGSLLAYYLSYIDPSSFSMTEMVFIMTITIIGRPGSFWGALAATVFLVLLPEPLRFVDFSPGILGPMRQLLYALILFSVVAWRREEIFPLQRAV